MIRCKHPLWYLCDSCVTFPLVYCHRVEEIKNFNGERKLTMELNEKILNDENLEEVQGGTQIPVIIKSGDTLGALAKKYNCTVDDLCRWNNIRDADQIEVGQKVVIKY